MLIEATIFGRYERLLNERWHLTQRYVHSSYQLDAPHQPVVAIQNAAALVGLESLDFAR